jgi:hypothetical protein
MRPEARDADAHAHLVFEALVEELVRLVEDEHLDVARPEVPPLDHVEDAAGGARDDVLAVVELADVLADRGATDTGVALDVHVVAEGEDDGLDLGRQLAGRGEDEGLGLAGADVDGLEDGDGKGGRLARPGLGLATV